MKIITANRLSDGRVIYADANGAPVESLSLAGVFEPEAAEVVLAGAAANPAVFVNPYLIEVEGRAPTGRDRLKERIRSAGPSVGHSLGFATRNETA